MRLTLKQSVSPHNHTIYLSMVRGDRHLEVSLFLSRSNRP
jgi:hypothetical protein